METETMTQSIWSKSKVLIKGLIILVLVLILMIPTMLVQDLIHEREERQAEAIAEVSSKWAGPQAVTAPMIVLPYWRTDTDNGIKRERSKHYAFFLPDQLNISSTIVPKEKYRGIYKVMLYNSSININGSFLAPDIRKLNILPEDVIWNEAFVKMHVSDVKGLNEELLLNWNGQNLSLSPQSFEDMSGVTGLSAPLPIASDSNQLVNFRMKLNLNGSEQLLFTPTGRSTNVEVNSKWPDPSFTGDILPQSSRVNDSGFTASWKSMAHKRAFPQQWVDNSYTITQPNFSNNRYATSDMSPGNKLSITTASFGTNLFVPVNGYQKTMRSVKYSALCILLTFAAFFLIETSNKKSVHPFQYALIGVALVLFYTLLLSISEYLSFNLSYAIASVATIGLITWFVRGILSSGKLSGLLAMILVLMYSYIFTILQLQDYSLLFGSIGLFVTLGAIMYFSRKFKW
jgi:inner membrane protein